MNTWEAINGLFFVTAGVLVFHSWRKSVGTWRKLAKERHSWLWKKLGSERPKVLIHLDMFIVDWMPRVLAVIAFLTGCLMLVLSFTGPR